MSCALAQKLSARRLLRGAHQIMQGPLVIRHLMDEDFRVLVHTRNGNPGQFRVVGPALTGVRGCEAPHYYDGMGWSTPHAA